MQYSTTFTPDEDGDWEIGLSVGGRGNLFFDKELALDLSTDPGPPRGTTFFGLGSAEIRTVIRDLKAGRTHTIEIRVYNREYVDRGPPVLCRGGIRFGAVRKISDEEGIEEAVELAKQSDGAFSRDPLARKQQLTTSLSSCDSGDRPEQRVSEVSYNCPRIC